MDEQREGGTAPNFSFQKWVGPVLLLAAVLSAVYLLGMDPTSQSDFLNVDQGKQYPHSLTEDIGTSNVEPSTAVSGQQVAVSEDSVQSQANTLNSSSSGNSSDISIEAEPQLVQ